MTETAKNWRHAMVNPSDRLHYLLTNQLHTDVTFSLPPIPGEEDRRVFHAHKLVLIAASPVFETMFTGPLKEDVVKVEDVGSEAWWILLEYVYTGVLPSGTTTIHTAVELMYAAEKYDLPDLSQKCSELLKSDLTKDNAITIFQAAQLLGDKELETRAEGWVLRNFHKLLEMDTNPTDFVNMTEKNLQHFLSKDELDVLELDLFRGVVKWSEHQVQLQSGTAESKSKCLQSLLPLLRFPLISAEEFSLHIVPSEVLPLEQSVLILQHLSCSKDKRTNLPPLPYSFKPRRSTSKTYCAHFAVRLTDMTYPYVSHILYYDSFEVDTPLQITHLGFPAPDLDDATYDVAIQIMVQSTNTLIYRTNQSVVCKRRQVMRVVFNDETCQVRIEPGILYKVVYKLKADQRIERFPVKSTGGGGNKIVNFRYIAYSCRLIEIGFRF
ncbi:BTB/POZ domain-containing protein 2 isoform X2 [Folsomia candida]|uniref:BTB/POZ domain-containing protein 2 isoform X2 n=1 Tax=Folsomia candida TaxID=158441 RepID=UPI000B8F24FA|nr:BTB/POZ domain-containing protein 2 isoform X2 [Folsomia candida]